MAMTLVSTVTVGSGGAASIEFTNIPQTGKDLLVVFSLRDDNASFAFDSLNSRINGDTGSNYSYRNLEGTGSSAGSSSETSVAQLRIGSINEGTSTSNTFNNGNLYLSNYTSSANKSISADVVAENNATSARQRISAGIWAQTNAITSVSVYSNGGNLIQHSTASLYIIS